MRVIMAHNMANNKTTNKSTLMVLIMATSLEFLVKMTLQVRGVNHQLSSNNKPLKLL